MGRSHWLVFLSVLSLFSQSALAELKKVSDQNGVSRYTLSQPLDHDKPAAGSFDQHLVVISPANRKAESRVLIESGHIFTDNIEKVALNQFNAFAKPMGAYMVVVEHRLVGQSGDLSKGLTALIPYLRFDQIVRDLNRVQKALISDLGLKGKWVATGGSYTASIAMTYAQRFPESVVGVYASSPSHVAMGPFTDAPVQKGIAVHGQKCVEKVDRINQWVEKELEKASAKDIGRFAKEVFGTKADVTELAEISFAIANFATAAIGSAAFPNSFCEYLETEFSKPSVSEKEILKGMAAPYRENYGDVFIETPSGAIVGLQANAPKELRAGAIWLHALCSDLGSFWVATESGKLMSKRVDRQFWVNGCYRTFGIDISKRAHGSWEGQKLVAHIEKPGHTLVVDGARDAWSLDWWLKEEHRALGKNGIYFRDAAGTHCGERQAFFPTEKQLQQQVINLITNW